LHASSAGLHGLLHHIHGRATDTTTTTTADTSRPMAAHAARAGEGLAVARELLLRAAIAKGGV
jgi:hypothetical protein